MDLVLFIGLLAAACTTISFLPQAVKAIRTRQTKDISLIMYILLNIGLLLWLIYGIFLNELPIIIANALTLAFTSIILVIKVRER